MVLSLFLDDSINFRLGRFSILKVPRLCLDFWFRPQKYYFAIADRGRFSPTNRFCYNTYHFLALFLGAYCLLSYTAPTP